MRDRCLCKTHKQYPSYGGRGITVCPQWSNFEGFLADMGPRPEGMSLDRIDVNGNYEPSNCRWATARQQMNNRRVTRYAEVNGNIRPIGEWSQIYGVPLETIRHRIFRGWPHKEAVTLPPDQFTRLRDRV